MCDYSVAEAVVETLMGWLIQDVFHTHEQGSNFSFLTTHPYRYGLCFIAAVWNTNYWTENDSPINWLFFDSNTVRCCDCAASLQQFYFFLTIADEKHICVSLQGQGTHPHQQMVKITREHRISALICKTWRHLSVDGAFYFEVSEQFLPALFMTSSTQDGCCIHDDITWNRSRPL